MNAIPCDPTTLTVLDPDQADAWQAFFPGGSDVDRFVNVVADEFAAWERRTAESGDRDEALIRFTLRALAEQGLPFSTQALEAVARGRAVTV